MAEIENPVASRVIVARIAFPERRVKAATEHAATRYEIAKRTLVGTKRVEPPVAVLFAASRWMEFEDHRIPRNVDLVERLALGLHQLGSRSRTQ